MYIKFQLNTGIHQRFIFSVTVVFKLPCFTLGKILIILNGKWHLLKSAQVLLHFMYTRNSNVGFA